MKAALDSLKRATDLAGELGARIEDSARNIAVIQNEIGNLRALETEHRDSCVSARGALLQKLDGCAEKEVVRKLAEKGIVDEIAIRLHELEEKVHSIDKEVVRQGAFWGALSAFLTMFIKYMLTGSA